MHDSNQATKCPQCGDTLIEGKSHCAGCGLAVGSTADRRTIDSYIQARINQELSARLKDQSSLVREIGDKAEDVVWGRLKRYTFLSVILLAILGWVGINKVDDAISKVVETARQRVEPLVQNAENRAKAAQGEIGKIEDKEKDLNKSLSDLGSNLSTAQAKVSEFDKKMQDYEARISKSGGGVLGQIDQLRDAVNRQQKSLKDTDALVLNLQDKVVDFGERDLKVGRIMTTGSGPSYEAYGTLGCPTVADALTKDGKLVAYCAQGSPPSLFQLTSTELRPVASLSPMGFQDSSTAPKPACAVANRGTFYVEKGTGRIADKPFLCIKRLDGTYEWIQLGMLP